MSMDKIDRNILRILQSDCKKSLEDISQECGRSVPSIQKRVQKLREAKIIAKEVAIISQDSVGLGMTFIIMVELERENLQDLEVFKRKIQKEDNVQQSYYVTGEADFVLICTAKNMEDFEELTNRLFFNDKNVRKFRTSVVMKRVKHGLTLPI